MGLARDVLQNSAQDTFVAIEAAKLLFRKKDQVATSTTVRVPVRKKLKKRHKKDVKEKGDFKRAVRNSARSMVEWEADEFSGHESVDDIE